MHKCCLGNRYAKVFSVSVVLLFFLQNVGYEVRKTVNIYSSPLFPIQGENSYGNEKYRPVGKVDNFLFGFEIHKLVHL